MTASYNPNTKVTSVLIQHRNDGEEHGKSYLDLILETSSLVHPITPFVMALFHIMGERHDKCADSAVELSLIEQETGQHPYKSPYLSNRHETVGTDLMSQDYTSLLFRLNAASSGVRTFETDGEGRLEQMEKMLGMLRKERKEPLIRDLDPGILKGLATHLEYSIQSEQAYIRKVRHLQAVAQTQLTVVSVL